MHFKKSYKLIFILMSQISIWPLRKTWLSTWWQNPWWQAQRSDASCSQPPGLHTSQEGFCLTPLCRSSPSHYITRFRGWRLATRTFGSLHRFSMRLRSGDWLGHCWTIMCFFLSHSFIALFVCIGSLSRLEYPSTTKFQSSPIPLMRCSCPVPVAEKHPKAYRVELMPKSLSLVSSDHNTFTQFSSESLANFRWSFAFLSRGPYGCCSISVIHSVVCYQMFSLWPWSQLP